MKKTNDDYVARVGDLQPSTPSSGSTAPVNEAPPATVTPHTPGPWEAVDDEGGIRIRPVNTGWELAFLAAGSWTYSDGMPHDIDANARLIAAAPELLAALKLIANYEGDGDDGGMLAPKPPYSWETVARVSVDVAKAAIKKAEGRE